MKKIGKIDIIGIPYTLFLYDTLTEFKKLQDDATERNERYLNPKDARSIDGYCDYMSKEIRVYVDEFTDPVYFATTLRHEITHAFLYEIGNSNHDDEDYVDKISKWTPQIENIYKRADAILATNGTRRNTNA